MYMKNEIGNALIVTTGLLFLIMLLGLGAFRSSMDEIKMANNQKSAIQARYVAESGIAEMLQWFQEPSAFPDSGFGSGARFETGSGNFFGRRMTDARGAPSFIDGNGYNQFSGTRDIPDFLYQPDRDMLNPLGDLFSGIGTLAELKIYGPTSFGAVATLEATGTTDGRIRRTVSAELTPSPIPPTRTAVQIGNGTDAILPVLVHWGDLVIQGEARFGTSLEEVPKKNLIAPIDGNEYGATGREDPWLDYYIGGAVLEPKPVCALCTEPFLGEGYGHLHQFQSDKQRDFGPDRWDYDRLKRFSQSWGRYFGSDRNGFLYRDGVIDESHRVGPSQALAESGSGDRQTFVFIDTVDQTPPNGTNLATLDLAVDYLEGIFAIEANVVFRPSGSGRDLAVWSPPPEGTSLTALRQSVILPAVHFKGILAVAGDLAVEGHPKIFGALVIQNRISGTGQPEIWYDADLGTGYYRGLPTVTLLRGSWYVP